MGQNRPLPPLPTLGSEPALAPPLPILAHPCLDHSRIRCSLGQCHLFQGHIYIYRHTKHTHTHTHTHTCTHTCTHTHARTALPSPHACAEKAAAELGVGRSFFFF